MKRYHFIPIFICLVLSLQAVAALPVRSTEDEEIASNTLKNIAASLPADAPADRGKIIASTAQSLVGKGYDTYYTTDSIAELRLNMEQFTPLSFINTLLAIADVAVSNNPDVAHLEDELQKFSCRRGENTGFPSIMWHSSDWIVDNTYRGNIVELTGNYDVARDKIRSLDYMSRNPEKFAAMKNPDVASKIEMIEFGFRNHRIPVLPKSFPGRKDFDKEVKDGDILVLVSNSDGIDLYRIGVVKHEADGPHLIFVNPRTGKVEKSDEGLKRYFNLVSKYFSGFRWLRLK